MVKRLISLLTRSWLNNHKCYIIQNCIIFIRNNLLIYLLITLIKCYKFINNTIFFFICFIFVFSLCPFFLHLYFTFYFTLLALQSLFLLLFFLFLQIKIIIFNIFSISFHRHSLFRYILIILYYL